MLLYTRSPFWAVAESRMAVLQFFQIFQVFGWLNPFFWLERFKLLSNISFSIAWHLSMKMPSGVIAQSHPGLASKLLWKWTSVFSCTKYTWFITWPHAAWQLLFGWCFWWHAIFNAVDSKIHDLDAKRLTLNPIALTILHEFLGRVKPLLLLCNLMWLCYEICWRSCTK